MPVTLAAVPVVFAALLGISNDTSARNAGFAAEPDAGPANTVFAVCVKGVAATVPEVVTAVDGVELSTMPSPVKVTLVTVPVPGVIVWQPNPVPDVQIRALVVALHEGRGKSEG